MFDPRRRSAAVREKLAPGASRIVLYAGRLAPEKRLDVMPVVRVLHNDDFRASLAGGARAWALRRTWSSVMNDLFDTCDRMVSTHAARVA